MPDAPSQSKSTSQAVKYSALAGALIGALLARPVIKPWMDQHVSDISWLAVASIAPWFLFSLYWEIQKKNSAPAVASESKFSRSIHVVLTNAALLLIFFPVWGLQRRFLPDLLFVKVIGLALECAGLALAIWARRILGRNWSGEITIKADHELIRNGPYGKIRHPIYTALLTMYLGTAIVSGQMHALVGLVIGIIAYLRKTRLEEANLVRAFGDKYIAYRAETSALFPGLY